MQQIIWRKSVHAFSSSSSSQSSGDGSRPVAAYEAPTIAMLGCGVERPSAFSVRLKVEVERGFG